MIALAGMRRHFHLAQKRVHLVAVQSPTSAHAAVTGHCTTDIVQPFLQRMRRANLRQIVRKITDQPRDLRLAQSRGDLAHDDGPGPELLEDEAQLGKLVGPRREPVRRRFVQIDYLGQ